MSECPVQREGVNWAVVTVVTRNYLHFARALQLSLSAVHPGAPVFALMVDTPPPPWSTGQEKLKIIPLKDLKLPRQERFLFQYTPFELTCALKSFALLHLFETTQVEVLLYFDGDVQVYGSLVPLLIRLHASSIALTPHLTRPRSTGEPDRWEMDVIDTGVFNGGFIGLRKSDEALAMLHWWRLRMQKWCKWETNHNDQGWLDGVPALFNGVFIERGSQYNAAPWNLSTRGFSEDDRGRVLVDGQGLCFLHFAGIEPEQEGSLSRVSRNRLAEEPAPVRRLYREYVARLQQCGMRECQSWGYQHARLHDGTEIRPEWRELIRADYPTFDGVDNPFALPASAFQRASFATEFKRKRRRILRALGVSNR